MTIRRVHDPETKAAVMAALLSGQGVNQVAEDFELPTSTVSRWKQDAVGYATEEDIGQLLLEFVAEGIRTGLAQQQHFRDPEWLAKQDAHALAVLHGVGFDKVARLLELLHGR